MNKAFVKENDDDDEDMEGALPAIPAGAKNYITPQGYRRIKDELLHLIDVERPEVVRIVHWAASTGTARKTAITFTASAACARSTGASVS